MSLFVDRNMTKLWFLKLRLLIEKLLLLIEGGEGGVRGVVSISFYIL